MGSVVQLRGANGSVGIEVLGYENPDAEDTSDANWLRCVVALEVRSFSASLPLAVTTTDFAELERGLDELLANLRGRAALETDEENFRFEVEAVSGGRMLLHGKLATHDRPKVALSFSFDTDQSYLHQTLEGVKEVLANFPIKLWT